MTSGIDPSAVLAKYYDGAYAATKDLIDVPFYVDLAKRIGGPVLEIGCGTGRVLPTARAGIAIHGVDSSQPMLGILTRRSSGSLRTCANGFAPIRVTCGISASKRKYASKSPSLDRPG